jgi:tetratricopeptide (TPR) repeat protein
MTEHQAQIRTVAIGTALLLAIALIGPVLADEIETARDLIDEGWWEEAEALLEKLLEEDESNPDTYNMLAEIYLMRLAMDRKVDWDRMEDFAKKAIELDPTESSYYSTLGNVLGLEAQNGSKFKAIGRARGARDAYEKAVELDPENIETRFWLIYFYIQAPGIAGGDKAKAREQAKAIARTDSLQGLLARAVIYEYLEEDYEKTEATLLRALAAQSEDSEPYFAYGLFSARRGEHARAESISAELLAQDWCDDETRTHVHFSLALMYQETERWEEAISEFEKALDTDSTASSALYHIGRACVLAETDLDRAEQVLKQYLRLPRYKGWWPERTDAHYYLAAAYDLSGEIELACQEVDKALDLDRKHEKAKELKNQLRHKRR